MPEYQAKNPLPLRYKCEYCQKQYKVEVPYQTHVKEHEEKGDVKPKGTFLDSTTVKPVTGEDMKYVQKAAPSFSISNAIPKSGITIELTKEQIEGIVRKWFEGRFD